MVVGVVRCAAAFVRAAVLFPLYFVGLTVFLMWPWRLGSPFRLVRMLGLLGRAPRASALRLILLRLEVRTDWLCRAPGRLTPRAVGQWLGRPFRETIPGCDRLARHERKWSGITRLERFTLFLNALPDSLRYANGMATRFWFDPERRADAANHIPNLPHHIRISCYLLNHASNPSLPLEQRHFDKVELHATCRRHGLPTVPVHASFRDGRTTTHEPVGDGPLLSKPAELAEGRGEFARWWPENQSTGGSRRYRTESGEMMPYTAILERLAERSLDTPYTLQTLMRNHRRIQDLSGVEALCTLPDFQEAVDLAVAAHASAFPTWPTVGWDLALTPEGPALLEMNIQWCAEHDIPEERFLGQTAYTDCVLEHIERLWPHAMAGRSR